MASSIFIISGPSGAGEDSVIEALASRLDFERVKTTVSRAMRPGEAEGKPYYFVSRGRFEEMIARDEFAEWAIVYEDYRGATKQEIRRCISGDKAVVWKVDWQGVRTIKMAYPEAVSVLIAPPSYAILEARLLRRGTDSSEEIKKRETFTREWLTHTDVYDHCVVNNEGALEATVLTVEHIIRQKLADDQHAQ